MRDKLSQNLNSRDRLVVRSRRCGRSTSGSNPGHGNVLNIVTGRIFCVLKLCSYNFLI